MSVEHTLKSSVRPLAQPDTDPRVAVFGYTNYRGEYSIRRAIPFDVRLGTTEWHPEKGLLLRAFDLDKSAEREFALKDCDFTVTSTRPVEFTKEEISELASRFVQTQVPTSTVSDACMVTNDYPHYRHGTNIMSASEAQEFFTSMLQKKD